MGGKYSINKSVDKSQQTDAIAFYDRPHMIQKRVMYINSIFAALRDRHFSLLDELLLTRVGTPDLYLNETFTVYHMSVIWSIVFRENDVIRLINTLNTYQTTFGPINRVCSEGKKLYIKTYKRNEIMGLGWSINSHKDNNIPNDETLILEAIIDLHKMDPLSLLHKFIQLGFFKSKDSVLTLLHKFLNTETINEINEYNTLPPSYSNIPICK